MGVFLIASGISIVLVLLCAAVFYEIMAHAWVNLPRLEKHPRGQIALTILAVFLAHTVAVWLFGLTYYGLDKGFHFGTLTGDITPDIMEYVYFSGVTYSSLGFSEVDATGGLQLLVVVESILGLILIGWTVAYTYIFTDKYLAHRLKRRQ